MGGGGGRRSAHTVINLEIGFQCPSPLLLAKNVAVKEGDINVDDDKHDDDIGAHNDTTIIMNINEIYHDDVDHNRNNSKSYDGKDDNLIKISI